MTVHIAAEKHSVGVMQTYVNNNINSEWPAQNCSLPSISRRSVDGVVVSRG